MSTEEPATRHALLLDDNLMSAVRIQSQLELAGYSVRTERSIPAALEETPQLVLINLGSRGLSAARLVTTCRERFPDSRVVGFCGHLETEIRRAAREAGIHKILTNDQAFTQLDKAL